MNADGEQQSPTLQSADTTPCWQRIKMENEMLGFINFVLRMMYNTKSLEVPQDRTQAITDEDERTVAAHKHPGCYLETSRMLDHYTPLLS